MVERISKPGAYWVGTFSQNGEFGEYKIAPTYRMTQTQSLDVVYLVQV